jgi:hypothetical protein
MWWAFLLLLHQAWQLYHTEGIYLLDQSVTTVTLRTVVKEMDIFSILHALCTEYITKGFLHIQISVTVTKLSELVIECTKKSGTVVKILLYDSVCQPGTGDEVHTTTTSDM